MIKFLSALVVGVLLSGCSVLSYLTPRQFDPVEYSSAVSVTQYATRVTHQCSNMSGSLYKPFVDELNTTSMFFVEYANNKKDNKDVADQAKQVRQMVLEFDSHQTPSAQYCVLKMSNIQNAARTTSRSLGRLNNTDGCSADLQSLWDKIKAAQPSLSKDESTELASDIVRLGRVNVALCSSQEREKIETLISIVKLAASL